MAKGEMNVNETRILRIGLIGAGYQCLKKWPQLVLLPGIHWVGVYDINPAQATAFQGQTGIPNVGNLDDLLAQVDVVYVATDTESHFPLAQMAIMAGKHVLLERPATERAEQMQLLINMAAEANVCCSVCYSGRFNPAWLSVKNELNSPLFIESHHLTPFNEQEIGASVVNDLMQDDLDVILPLVNSELKRISATGVKVAHDTPDIANARLEFANGCVVNLTASRISLKPVRKMRIFERNAYHSLDFVQQKADFVSMQRPLNDEDSNSQVRDIPITAETHIVVERKPVNVADPFYLLWADFIEAVRANKRPLVVLEDVYRVMETGERILKKINSLGEE
jgi:predicted dehydrogenase